MHPLTPYTKTYGPFTAGGYVTFLKQVDGYRQVAPYNIVTRYRMDQYSSSGQANASSWSFGPPPATQPLPIERAFVSARNRAYSKWLGKAKSDAASLGATLTAERRDTWAMFVRTVTKALRAAQAVKAMQFGRAAGILGVPYKEYSRKKRVGYRTEIRYDKRQRRRRPTRVPVFQKVHMMKFGPFKEMIRSLGGGWLLYSYGVKPLMDDLKTAMEVLTSEVPTKRSKASAKAKAEYYQSRDEMGGFTKYTGSVGTVCGGTITIQNHDLYLATQLGLTNPVSWLLEGIPFSFVVDWFSNLSDVVNSMSELGGLSVTDSFTSERYVLTDTRVVALIGKPPEMRYDKKWICQIRTPGLKPPVLQFAWERWSWQRGANAISLLVQFLKKA